MQTHDSRAFWKQAFTAIIDQYQEAKSVTGSIGAMNYERSSMSVGGGSGPRTIRPTLSDFVADVELAARRALADNRAELEFFFRFYVPRDTGRPAILTDAREQLQQSQGYATAVLPPSVPDNELNTIVMEKVGKMLCGRHIYPIHDYMAAKQIS